FPSAQSDAWRDRTSGAVLLGRNRIELRRRDFPIPIDGADGAGDPARGHRDEGDWLRIGDAVGGMADLAARGVGHDSEGRSGYGRGAARSEYVDAECGGLQRDCICGRGQRLADAAVTEGCVRPGSSSGTIAERYLRSEAGSEIRLGGRLAVCGSRAAEAAS